MVINWNSSKEQLNSTLKTPGSKFRICNLTFTELNICDATCQNQALLAKMGF